jgi:GNAT superfamily N-acetyltransferase
MSSPIQSGDEMLARAALRGDDITRARCRSFCFLEREGARWTAFLITYLRPDGYWRGYFTFRSGTAEVAEGEIRTADLFVEESEADVDLRARGLGRPLLSALLNSALETAERRRGYSPELHRWFRDLLAERSDRRTSAESKAPGLAELRSLYESYRLDQVAHLIALLEPEQFREMVEILLDGRRIDYRERDRFQLAMNVVQDLERRLPLPPFELWAEDYLRHPEIYRDYTYRLHQRDQPPD